LVLIVIEGIAVTMLRQSQLTQTVSEMQRDIS
jgi:hypothetical protein